MKIKPANWQALKVLIVDENIFFRGVVRSIVRSARIEVFKEAASLGSALKMLESFTPDLVICESSLGDGDWIRLHEEVCARFRDDVRPRFILITSSVDKSTVEAARQHEVSDIVLKPITAALLLTRMAQVFRISDRLT